MTSPFPFTHLQNPPQPASSPYPPFPSPNPINLLGNINSPFTSFVTPNYPTSVINLGLPSLGPLPAPSSAGRKGDAERDVDFGDILRGLGEMEGMISKAEDVLKSIKTSESAVFSTQAALSEDQSRSLQALHTEYTQMLHSLIAISTSSLTGALPIPLSAALPSNLSSTPLKMQDLTVWAEERAGLEFSRRESVRAAAKGVEDVLRLSGAR